jgi:uncharacterized protein (TIGR00106 family)
MLIHGKEKDMLAEISVFPLDKGGSGLSKYVADAVKAIINSGLDYEVHAFGTLVEGPPEKVWDVIRQCHEIVAARSDRVMMNIKIDDRKGYKGAIKGKVKSVKAKLPE